MINKRILSTLLALAILLSCVGWTPAQAQGAALVDAAGTKQYIYPTGACSSTNSDVYCVFTIDVNEMQRYTDNVIPLDFAIQGLEETERFTVTVTGTVPLEHNQLASHVYTSANNEVSLRISVLEPRKMQNVSDLEYDYITINIQNSEGLNVYSIEAALVNTQYGLFVSYVNDELLFIHYLRWLRDNAYISTAEYNTIDTEYHTAEIQLHINRRQGQDTFRCLHHDQKIF